MWHLLDIVLNILLLKREQMNDTELSFIVIPFSMVGNTSEGLWKKLILMYLMRFNNLDRFSVSENIACKDIRLRYCKSWSKRGLLIREIIALNLYTFMTKSWYRRGLCLKNTVG
jgi:hypothetical protein